MKRFAWMMIVTATLAALTPATFAANENVTTVAALKAHVWAANDVVTMAAGDYVLDANIAINQAGCTLQGAGPTTIIKYGAAVNPITVTGDNVTLSNFAIDWHNGAALGGVGAAGYGVIFLDCTGGQILDCDFQGFNQTGVIVQALNVAANLTANRSHFHHTLYDCIGINPTAGGGSPAWLTVIDCEADHATNQSGFENDVAGTMIVIGGYSHDNGLKQIGTLGDAARATLNKVYRSVAVSSSTSGDPCIRASEVYHTSTLSTVLSTAGAITCGGEIVTGLVEDCVLQGVGAVASYGIYSRSGVALTVRRTRISGFSRVNYGYGIWFQSSTTACVLDCVDISSCLQAARAESSGAGASVAATNCRFVGTDYGIVASGAAAWTVKNTIIYGGTDDVAAGMNTYNAASGYNLWVRNDLSGWTKKSTDVTGAAAIDSLLVPYERGNCDIGKGDPTARSLGALDLYGRPKLRQGDVIGPVYPQRRRAENLIEPAWQFAQEAASLTE